MKSFFAGALFLAGALAARGASADPSQTQSTTPVTAAELQSFRGEVPAELFGTASLTGAVPEAIGWRCDASSVYYGGDFYWISYNLAYSRYQALSYCESYYGTACAYQCETVWL